MPLYEYKCKECGLVVEKIQKVNDMPLKKCSRCGGVLVWLNLKKMHLRLKKRLPRRRKLSRLTMLTMLTMLN